MKANIKNLFSWLAETDDDIKSGEKYILILKICLAVHCVLFFTFWQLHVWLLMFFNLGSVTLYYILIRTIRSDRYLHTFLAAYGEIVVHTILCIIMIGNDFGFQLYIPALIPILFYIVFSLDQYGHLRYPIIYPLASFVLFAGACAYNLFFPPVYTNLPESSKLILFLFNSLIVFGILILFSLLFILQIRNYIAKIQNQTVKLAAFANTDPLTGLLNRRKFTEGVSEVIRSGDNFCIILSDIDDFKKVNDTYGHDCGDQVLVHVTSLFKELVNAPDFVCRWGGEEIIVLFHGDRKEAHILGEKIRTAIETSPIVYDGQEVRTTITLGLADFDWRESVDHTIMRADHALYSGKQHGKNQLCEA